MNKNQSSGVESIEIRFLEPMTNYWFTVRAGNGCATGAWSTWLKATPNTFSHKY